MPINTTSPTVSKSSAGGSGTAARIVLNCTTYATVFGVPRVPLAAPRLRDTPSVLLLLASNALKVEAPDSANVISSNKLGCDALYGLYRNGVVKVMMASKVL